MHFEFGQNRVTQPHSLKTFELAQGAIEGAFEARFVAKQTVELFCGWNHTGEQFHIRRFWLLREAF